MAPRPKRAEPRPAPRLYLVTPRLHDAAAFAAPLTAALAAADVAAVLLRLAPADEGTHDQARQGAGAGGAGRGRGAHDRRPCRFGRPRRAPTARIVTGMAEFGEAIEHLKPDRIVGVGGLVDAGMTP